MAEHEHPKSFQTTFMYAWGSHAGEKKGESRGKGKKRTFLTRAEAGASSV